MPAPATPPRKFRPELVETSAKSSKSKRDKQTPASPSEDEASTIPDGATREQKPERFKAVPIETTRSSNRQAVEHNSEEDAEEERPDYGPLLPHERAPSSSEESMPPARRKFAVELVESSSRSNMKMPDQPLDLKLAGIESKDQAESAQTDDTSKKPARRKFKVELIETAKRTHKSGDSTPALQASDKTNASASDASGTSKPPRPPIHPLPPTNTPYATSESVPMTQLLKPLPNRQGSMRPHNNTRMPTRSHSFKVPNLESIESSESDRSNEPSAPGSGSHSPPKDRLSSDATRMRESNDERFSGYLLALAARAAEKQLRDQEAALFLSTDKHEPVMHYVDHEDSESEGVESRQPSPVAVRSVHPTRRDSGDEKLILKEMQQHGEQRRKDEGSSSMTEQRGLKVNNVDSGAGAQTNAWNSQSERGNHIGGVQQLDPDMRQMRTAASPPMLGGDLDFPRCHSPDHARFDVTQGSDLLRSNMCYLMNQETPEGGLWAGLCKPEESMKPTSSTTGSEQTRAPASESLRPPPLSNSGRQSGKPGVGGLWGGFCNVADAKVSSIPTGLMTPKRTPAVEKEDPFAAYAPGSPSNTNTGGTTVAGPRRYPQPLPSPPNSASGIPPTSSPEAQHSRTPTAVAKSTFSAVSLTKAAEKASITARLEHAFPDTFVTQVYNYLSLGFPALARKYDDELAKISGMSVVELRRDDSVSDQRGYMRLGEGENDVSVRVKRQEDLPNEEKAGDCAIPKPGSDRDVEQEDMCNRWCALRIYVREWGRQMGCGEEGGEVERRKLDPSRAWGMPARKGSWGN